MAHGAAPASATDGVISDIARGTALRPVNPLTATSAMGRGADQRNHEEIGESGHRLEDTRDIRDIGDLQHGTSDGQDNRGHRGT